MSPVSRNHSRSKLSGGLFRPLLPLLLVCGFSAWAGEPVARRAGMTEQGWIIETIVRDGAQMAALAAKAKDPLSPERTVEVKAEPAVQGSPPSYQVSIRLGPEGKNFEARIIPAETVWSSSTYAACFGQILDAFQTVVPENQPVMEQNPLEALCSPLSLMLQSENRRVSRALTENPVHAEAHEQAALICAMLGLKEQGRQFWDPRRACNRAAAHLATAAALRKGRGEVSDSGKVADLILGLLLDRKEDCAKKIAELESRLPQNSKLRPWIVAARLRNSRDWRLLQKVPEPTLLELLEAFRAKCESVSSQSALEDLEKNKIDADEFADVSRIILQFSTSVQLSHRFDTPAVQKEVGDQASVYGKNRIQNAQDLISLLNSAPGGAVQKSADGKFTLMVLDDGIWGQFFQRHLLYAMLDTKIFLRDRWGVKEYAERFEQESRAQFQSLSLFPLYEAWQAKQPADLAPAAREALAKVMNEHPEQVSGVFWWRISDKVGISKGDGYNGPAPSEWFNPIVPTGTAFSALPRLFFLAKEQVKDPGFLRPYLEIAPSRVDLRVAYVKSKYGDEPPAQVLKEEFGEAMEFNLDLMKMNAATLKNDPAAYPVALGKIAGLEAKEFETLAEYQLKAGNPAKAAEAYQNFFDRAPDRVGVANSMGWLVNYYEENGRQNEATKIAEAGAEVYSYAGLEIMAKLMERREKFHLAESYYAKIAERYDDKTPLAGFYLRNKKQNPNYEAAAEQQKKEIFPDGLQKVALSDFKDAPDRGVLTEQGNELTEKAGLQKGAIIVALDGIRVATMEQYLSLRAENASPVLKLIVYQNGKYQEIEASPPGKRFGIGLSTFSRK